MYEKIKTALKCTHLLFFLLLLTLLSFFGAVTQDRLLFKTDVFTLTQFFLSLNFLLLAILIIPCLVLVFSLKAPLKAKIINLFYKCIIFIIAYTFFANLLNNKYIIRAVTLKGAVIVNVVAIIISFLVVLMAKDKDIIINLKKISGIVFIVSLLAFTAIMVINHLNKPEPDVQSQKKKNIIFFVVDGLSTKILKEYNEKGPLSIASLSDNYLVFENIRTNYTYTYGYFNALYSGRKCGYNPGSSSLFSYMQANNIDTMWMVAHSSAVPDSHGIRHYTGFRSSVVTHHFSWLPKLLGIHYNVYRSPREKDGYIIDLIHKIMNRLNKGNDFRQDIFNEVKRLRERGRSFLFFIHTFPAFESSPPKKMWRELKVKTLKDKAEAKIRKNDYAYTKETEWLVEEWREESLKAAQRGFDILKKLLEDLEKNGRLEDTLVVITADHGKILSRGKVFYGYHHDEEVARVPFIIIGANKKGRDPRLGETIDISGALLDNFGIKQKLDNNAVSLFGSSGKNRVTALTTYSEVRNQQFLAVYKLEDGEIYKYLLNLEDKTFYYKYRLSGYSVIPEGKYEMKNSAISPEFDEFLKEYTLAKPWMR